ncbi:patatin-like protein [Nocardioides sp. KR10-350]|uniref:patatin-like protein n=1 Tax=Nocardioides cheoyonin TaxID=3156615 RepID=UPI0032B33819
MTRAAARAADPGAGLLSQPGIEDVPPEELRLAVVLNGGVSLAVWMGGATVELDRLTRADRTRTSPYGLLLRLAGCTARADVIAGTSAGGINGAALALAQTNPSADLGLLRDLWTEQGRIDALLRPPFQGAPTSLLQGDEYFLPQLDHAFGLLARVPRGAAVSGPDRRPVDLTITTTVLRGNQGIWVDSMGQRIPQSLHAGRFHWSRLPTTGADADPFAAGAVAGTAHELALAARATASFPGAFEPTFIPVGREDPTPRVAGYARPDMAKVVSGWGDGAQTDRSRYVVDGGVLANTPTIDALRAIEAMPAQGPVRRVMLLVFPHAPLPTRSTPDDPDSPPTLTMSLSQVFGALTAQGSRAYVEELERHNLDAAGRRGTRGDILESVDGPDELRRVAEGIYKQFRRLRRWRVGRDLAAWRTGVALSRTDGSGAQVTAEWGFERVRYAAQRSQDEWEQPQGGLPYAPLEKDDGTGHEGEGGPVHCWDAAPGGDGWAWGVTGALGVAEAAGDLLRRMIWVTREDEGYDKVRAARCLVDARTATLRDLRSVTDSCWETEPALLALPPDETYWTLRLAFYDRLMLGNVVDLTPWAEKAAEPGDPAQRDARTSAIVAALDRPDHQDPGSLGREVSAVVDEILDALVEVSDLLDAAAVRDPSVAAWRTSLFPEDGSVDRDALRRRFLQLEVLGTVFGDEIENGNPLPVELVLLSAQTQNAFATRSETPADKLGGDSVNRFGGFLKRSWRVNDWIWGRADAATMLCRTVLDPKRIRRTASLAGYLDGIGDPRARAEATVAGIERHLGDQDLLPDRDLLADLHAGAVEELADVFDPYDERTGEGVPDGNLPSALPCLAELFAWALHLESLPAELGALVKAIRADHVEGANRRSHSERFVKENEELLARIEKAGPDGHLSARDRRTSLTAFDASGIGREPLRDETTSDLVLRTTVTAAASFATLADSSRAGLGALRPVTRAVRSGMLLPYWSMVGLTSKSKLARAVVLLGFAIGGVLLALALLGALPGGLSGPAAAIGGAITLGAFAYSALRTGALVHGVVLLTPLLPLAVYAVTGTAAQQAERERGLSTVVVVVVLAVALMLLGSIAVARKTVWSALAELADAVRLPRRTPFAGRPPSGPRRVWLDHLWAVVRRVTAVLVPAAAVAAVVAAVWFAGRGIRRVVTTHAVVGFVQDHALLVWLPVAGLAVLAAGYAFWSSRRLQVLSRGSRPGVYEFHPVSDPAAVASGWALLYGFAYVAVAAIATIGRLPLDDHPWGRTVFLTAAAFGAFLALVYPALVCLRVLRRFERSEVRAGRAAADEPDEYAADLVARGTAYRRYVTTDGLPLPVVVPTLTRAGERLRARVAAGRVDADRARKASAERARERGELAAEVLAAQRVASAQAKEAWESLRIPKARVEAAQRQPSSGAT